MCLPPCTAELPAVLSQLCPPRWMRMARVTSRWICLRIHRLSRAHSTASGTLSRRSLRTELEGSPRSARDDFAPGARWLTTGVDLQRLTPPMLPRLGAVRQPAVILVYIVSAFLPVQVVRARHHSLCNSFDIRSVSRCFGDVSSQRNLDL